MTRVTRESNEESFISQEDAVKEIIGTQPLNLKTYFLTITAASCHLV
jgi:hypothetical protein